MATRPKKRKRESSSGDSRPAKDAKYGGMLLGKQLRDMMRSPPDGFSVGLVDEGDMYRWKVMIEGPSGTLYEGGFFPAELIFPDDYPSKPPVMRFTTKGFWHPNVHADGKVCISILHEAKEDSLNAQEKMSEKWRPILGVESILLSVVSLLSDPNLESPANVDASVEFRNDPAKYKKRVLKLVQASLAAL